MTIMALTSRMLDSSLILDAGLPRSFLRRVTIPTSLKTPLTVTSTATNPYTYVDPETDESQKLLVVTEAYLQIDINHDGIAELCKVVCIGEHEVTDILDIEEVPEIPFVAVQAIPSPYSPFGVSIFDRVRQIQDLKTAILRATMDSFYQNTNKMKVVQEGQVNLDDLLTTRPGGIIRAKGHNAVMEIGGTPMGQEAFQLLQFADEQKRSTYRRIGRRGDAQPVSLE